VEFRNYKALHHYSLRLQRTNILVGPNNCGKSTIVGAFKALSAALRRAKGKAPTIIMGPEGRRRYGHWVSADSIPISIENVHSDYAEADTTISFEFSNRNSLKLYFPKEGKCALLADARGVPLPTAAAFRKAFPFDVSIVPVLGPVEHKEPLLAIETVQRDLMTHRASRHFRNYWYHFPDGFDEFAALVRVTWPGMDILQPEVTDFRESTLSMFCLESRITRELYWAGFGFQVWCQLLTHIGRTRNSNILVIDEPEIYLYADLQRQLVSILRDLGRDVLLATHSTEIMAEADPAEILLVDKTKRVAERLKNVERLQQALDQVGSVQNITLTRLARSRKVLFVEDEHDFKIIRLFARVLGLSGIAGFEITPVKSGGFSSWKKVSALGWGLEKALGQQLSLGAVYDRDYFCSEEIVEIVAELKKTVQLAHVHTRKEMENYLLQPDVLDRALRSVVSERALRAGEKVPDIETVAGELAKITEKHKTSAQGQYVGKRVDFFRGKSVNPATVATKALDEFGPKWEHIHTRLELVPGKEVLAELRQSLSERYGVSHSDNRIVNSYRKEEIPPDLTEFLIALETFRTAEVPSTNSRG
jgi:energy-coupling factor transporter ATP-binding protein EcfA2